MQDQKVIDHLVFRKLFAESFSAFTVNGFRGRGGDEYVIEPEGVRWHITEDEYLQGPGRLGGPTDADTLYWLSKIKLASLPFPCSPTQALNWVARSASTWIYTPDWLIESLAQDSPEKAIKIIEAAIVQLNEKEKSAGAAFADAIRDAREDDADLERTSEINARTEAQSASLAVEAFREIELLMEAPKSTTKKRTRSDLMDAEIKAILKSNPRLSPTEVMAELQLRAGMANTCATEKIPEGVMWRDAGGGNRKLTMGGLYSRLSRMPKRN